VPPAIAELISNAYDADASQVTIKLIEDDESTKTIIIADDGDGLSYNEINDKFLVIGRNRRIDDGDEPSKKFSRRPTGKKGLGKLALFGVANTITIRTIKNRLLNEFILDWENPEMNKLREFLSGIISQINQEWRKKRKERKSRGIYGLTFRYAQTNTI